VDYRRCSGLSQAASLLSLLMTSSPSLVAAAAIVDDLHQPAALLAARRSAPKSLAGQWEFPGGKVEPGEDGHGALHREIEEELGVQVTIGARVPGPDGGDWPILHGHRMRVWFASVQAGQPAPLADHDELRWLQLGDLFTVPWLAPDVPIVTAVARWLQDRAPLR